MPWTASLYDGVTATPVQVVDPEGYEIDYAMEVAPAIDGSSFHVFGDLKPNAKDWSVKVRVAAADFQELVTAMGDLYRAAEAATEFQLTDGTTTYIRSLKGFVSMEELDDRAIAVSAAVVRLTFVPSSAYWTNGGVPVVVGL